MLFRSLEVPAVGYADLDLPPSGDTSAQVAARVVAARARQNARFADHPQLRTNADAEGTILDEITRLDSETRDMMVKAADRFHLSARGYHRILRVARTIADLDHSDQVERPHVAEALSYRLIAARDS